MSILEIIGGIIIVLMSIAIVILVLLQESPKGTGISALTGGEASSHYNKNMERTPDARRSKMTKWLCGAFFIIAVAAGIAHKFIVA